MKSAAVLATGVLAVAACARPEPAPAPTAPTPVANAADAPLPASLAALYPPQAPQPTFLLQMLQLDAALAGVVVDVTEGDAEHAPASFAAFQAQYAAAAALVPEWADRYSAAPVAALGRALQGTDPGPVMAAVERIGGLCHACHATAMVRVQQRFRWGSFAAVRPEDPVQGRELDFGAFKRMLATNLNGVTHDLRQGQTANARRQFDELEARFRTLKTTCLACHSSGNRHFVAGEVTDLLAQARAAMADDAVSADTVAPLLQRLGQQSCAGCHLVHGPAALAPK